MLMCGAYNVYKINIFVKHVGVLTFGNNNLMVALYEGSGVHQWDYNSYSGNLFVQTNI